MKGRSLVSTLQCNNERHRAKHSSRVRAAREKLLAVPRPIAGMQLCKMAARNEGLCNELSSKLFPATSIFSHRGL